MTLQSLDVKQGRYHYATALNTSVCQFLNFIYLFSKKLSAVQVGLDEEQSMVVEVRDDGLVVGREADAARRVEILPHRAFEAVLAQELPVGREKLDPVIPGVWDENLILAVARDVPRVVELSRFETLLAEREDEVAVEGENLSMWSFLNIYCFEYYFV